MALTTLDPKTALIVIDLQKGIVALPIAHAADGIVQRADELAAAFRQHHLPVVLVNVADGAPGRTEQKRRNLSEMPAGWTELVPELKRQPSDIIVTKRTWGAFSYTDLHAQLQKAGVTQIVLCGIATSAGVESTARQAHELGYHVTFAADAMTDMNADAHHNSVTRIFPRIGEPGSTAEVIALLAATRT